MGNQTSVAARKQNDLSFHDDTKETTPEGTQGSLSSESILKPTSIRGNRFVKSKFPRQASGSSTSSISTAISPTAKPVKMLETIGTDGASTPKSEPYRLDLPVGTVSPPETSALSRGVLGKKRAHQPSAPPQMTPEPCVGSSSKLSSPSTSSEFRSWGQPMSTTEMCSSLFPRTRLPVKIPAPPLLPIHLGCYQSHGRMIDSPNKSHPVPCMVCGCDDEQLRWTCSWCSVRICGACSKALVKIKGKDLGTLIKITKGKGRQVPARGAEGGANSGPQRKDSDAEGDPVPPSPSLKART
ncbi:MAG: hypothetical protein Q9210_000207 [Variospora velana]